MLHKQKRNVFIIAQKSLYIWATFVTQIFTQNIEKSPNLVTLPNLPKCHGDLYKLPSQLSRYATEFVSFYSLFFLLLLLSSAIFSLFCSILRPSVRPNPRRTFSSESIQSKSRRGKMFERFQIPKLFMISGTKSCGLWRATSYKRVRK